MAGDVQKINSILSILRDDTTTTDAKLRHYNNLNEHITRKITEKTRVASLDPTVWLFLFKQVRQDLLNEESKIQESVKTLWNTISGTLLKSILLPSGLAQDSAKFLFGENIKQNAVKGFSKEEIQEVFYIFLQAAVLDNNFNGETILGKSYEAYRKKVNKISVK